MRSESITAALFDIGNVILPFDYERAGKRLAALSPTPREPDRGVLAEAGRAFELGQLDRAAFLRRVRPEFGHSGSEDEFLAIWEDIFEPNPGINALIEELAERMPLFLLSNIGEIHRESVHRDYPIFRHFRSGIYSYEVGCMKPDPRIFSIAIERLGVDPQRTLYLDDLAENIAAGRAAGFRCVHYAVSRHEEALAEIQRILGAG